MSTENNKQKKEAVKELILDYCDANLNKMYKTYILNLWDAASRNKSLNMNKGKNEIWAASLIYVIAKLNFLCDQNNPDGYYITLGALCDFFQTNIKTISNKAKQITKICNIRIGQPEYSNSDIMDMTTFFERHNALRRNNSTAKEMLAKKNVVETASEQITKTCNIRIGQPEYNNSDIMDMTTFFERHNALRRNNSTAKEMLAKKNVVEIASEEESAEINHFVAEQKRLEDEKLQQKKARRLEINRKIAEQKKTKKRESCPQQLSLFDI